MKRLDDLNNGKSYRVRRGRLVEIPAEWVNAVTHPETIRKRQSKLPRKLRRFTRVLHGPSPRRPRGGVADGAGSRTHALRDAIREGLE